MVEKSYQVYAKLCVIDIDRSRVLGVFSMVSCRKHDCPYARRTESEAAEVKKGGVSVLGKGRKGFSFLHCFFFFVCTNLPPCSHKVLYPRSGPFPLGTALPPLCGAEIVSALRRRKRRGSPPATPIIPFGAPCTGTW